MAVPLISVLGVGGTIANRPTPDGPRPVVSARELLADIAVRDTEFRVRDVLTWSSRDVGAQEIWQIAMAVRAEIEQGADGVVITHGTDTIEETAYGLALLVDTTVPVVLTGAMRAAHLPGHDGPANLRAAIAVASCAQVAAYGPVVAIHDEIHLATLVTKQHSARVAAFTSPSAGPIGFVLEDEPVLVLGPSPLPARLPTATSPSATVAIVSVVGGAGRDEIDALAGVADGLVVAATGGGHVSRGAAAALVDLAAAGKPIVLASRCSDGPVLARTYAGPGSETELLAAGAVRAIVLDPVKARLRLLFGLSAGLAPLALFPPGVPNSRRREESD